MSEPISKTPQNSEEHRIANVIYLTLSKYGARLPTEHEGKGIDHSIYSICMMGLLSCHVAKAVLKELGRG